MSDWQERITRETAPAIAVEHELRYRAAAPLVHASGVWADLGCGNGLAAAAALADRLPAEVVLVDVEQSAIEQAARELGAPRAHTIAADLADVSELAAIGELLARSRGPRTVTCFEVVEHLATFVPLLEFSGELARAGEATFVISVPNDAFWSVQNPHHASAWGEGAFEELRRLLPAEHTSMRQVSLSGSALVDSQASVIDYELRAEAGGADSVATHFLVAYGPAHEGLWRGALAVQTDMLEQRTWERQRENNIAVMEQLARVHEARIEELEAEIIVQGEKLRANTAEFDEWREYIHRLEQELGRPLAGSPEAPPPAKPAEHTP